MTPAIRIDEDVYRWLQSQAKPFEDSPNSVLRRIAGIENRGPSPSPSPSARNGNDSASARLSPGMKRLTGLRLAKRWGVEVEHALYHRDGTFYENLTRFPGALFDPTGFVVFRTAQDYNRSEYLRRGDKLNVPRGIASLPGYVRKVK